MRKVFLLLTASLLLPFPASAESVSGRVIGLDIIRRAIYVSHEASGETRGDNKFIWDDNVPGRQYLQDSSIGDTIRLEAEREENHWRVTSVPAPPDKALFDPEIAALAPQSAALPLTAASDIPMRVFPPADPSPPPTPAARPTAAISQTPAPSAPVPVAAEPPAPIAARPRVALPKAPPMTFEPVAANPLPAPSPAFRSQFQIEETRLAPAVPLPAPAVSGIAIPEKHAPRKSTAQIGTSIQPSNERPAPVTRRALSDAPSSQEDSGEPEGKNRLLGFLADSINGAARSVDGAIDQVFDRS